MIVGVDHATSAKEPSWPLLLINEAVREQAGPALSTLNLGLKVNATCRHEAPVLCQSLPLPLI